jgi:hypothetical protein
LSWSYVLWLFGVDPRMTDSTYDRCVNPVYVTFVPACFSTIRRSEFVRLAYSRWKFGDRCPNFAYMAGAGFTSGLNSVVPVWPVCRDCEVVPVVGCVGACFFGFHGAVSSSNTRRSSQQCRLSMYLHTV